ncbi:hypothetical protein FHK92_12730 [Pseudomonas brassicacearum subsp. neoaurantiaca]|uniref:Secreted protein n=1 Tax=Pseudomonas brassicacearum subsp. neoaurantiaca TaxID=494916 RepID=A0A7V8RLD9_9PSED|nr:hypothetical protein [Pseudomonas brassicacearum subsp. neoaurantiaca]
MCSLWRGSLLPLGCAATHFLVNAAHSSGSKLPRHGLILSANAPSPQKTSCKTQCWPFIQLSYFSHRVFTRLTDTWPT